MLASILSGQLKVNLDFKLQPWDMGSHSSYLLQAWIIIIFSRFSFKWGQTSPRPGSPGLQPFNW